MALNPFLKKSVVVNPRTRQPINPVVRGSGSGLNPANQPKQPAVAIVNPLARSTGR